MGAIIFILGLIVGSFLNCVIYRLEVGEGLARGRSYCPHCKHQLGFWDLIPVLSFIWLKGRCRYCKEKISWQYPSVELATGLLFVLFFVYIWQSDFPQNLEGSRTAFLIPFLVVIFVYDLKHYIIPDKVIFPAIGISFLFRVLDFENWNLFGIYNLGFGILPSVFLLAIILVSRGRWMGLGDFKLAILMGLILGFPNILVALFMAFLIGAIIGLGLIVFGRKSMKSEVPFGPFLVIGTLIALFIGDNLIDLYVQGFYFN